MIGTVYRRGGAEKKVSDCIDEYKPTGKEE